MSTELKIFFGNSNPDLAMEICAHLDLSPGKMRIHKFSNDNIKVNIEENVRNDDVFVIQTASSPVNEHLMELLIIIDALKYASVKRITAVLPYYFYARSDKKDEPRISITARLVSDLLQAAGADRILTMNLHSPQIMGFSRIPVDQLLSNEIILNYIKNKDLNNAVVAAPDVGSAKNSRDFAKALNLPLVVLDKQRMGDQEKVKVENIIGDVRNKDVLIFDDEILSARSMIEAARVLKEHNAKRLFASATHGYFSGDALANLLSSDIEEILVTNTLPVKHLEPYKKIKILTVAELFAKAIYAIHMGESVGALFQGID